MSRMAKGILAITVSIVASESTFNTDQDKPESNPETKPWSFLYATLLNNQYILVGQ